MNKNLNADKLETIVIEKSQRNPGLIALLARNNNRGWNSITFQEGEPLTDTVKHLRRLADLIEKSIE